MKNMTKKYIIYVVITLLSVCITLSIVLITTKGYVYANGVKLEHISNTTDIKEQCVPNMHVFEDANLEECVTYTYNMDDMNALNLFIAKAIHKDISVEVTYAVDVAKLKKKLQVYSVQSNEPKNACISTRNNKYFIVPDEKGSVINIDKLLDDVSNGKTNIKVEDYYETAEITTETLQPIVDSANAYLEWSCTWEKGEVLTPSLEDIVITEDNDIEVNTDFIQSYIKENIKQNYTTVGYKYKFKDHNGEDNCVTGGTYGSIVDVEKEFEEVCNAFNKKESLTNREPIYTKKCSETIEGDYIEVSIEDQHIWVYKNNEIVKDSDVVTGRLNKTDTPKGAYYIQEHIKHKIMRGPGYATPCDYWMRLNERGIGLHDATWRDEFGGNIYTYDGSHGCINLPYEFAKWLYENTEDDLCVVIH